ncbi:MAG: phosphatase PAP2 family protein [bacterium]
MANRVCAAAVAAAAAFLLLALIPAWTQAAGVPSPSSPNEAQGPPQEPSPVCDEAQRSLRHDLRDVFFRVPSVLKEQWISREGIRFHLMTAPLLGLSFIEEREVSDFFRRNRIGKDTIADTALDHAGGRFFPLFAVPLYIAARHFHNDEAADLAIDMATFSMTAYPQLLAMRFIGDRPRPNGEEDLAFGLKSTSSFPSGHAAMSVGIVRLIDHHFGKAVGIPLYLVSAGVSYQRLGNGDHYLADSIGGTILGLSAAQAVIRVRERSREPEEDEEQAKKPAGRPEQAVMVLPILAPDGGGFAFSCAF